MAAIRGKWSHLFKGRKQPHTTTFGRQAVVATSTDSLISRAHAGITAYCRSGTRYRGQRSFCGAAIGRREMTLWVRIDRFAMVAPCPLLPRKRPDRCITATAARARPADWRVIFFSHPIGDRENGNRHCKAAIYIRAHRHGRRGAAHSARAATSAAGGRVYQRWLGRCLCASCTLNRRRGDRINLSQCVN